MGDNQKAQSGGVTRRNLIKLTTAMMTSIPIVGGKLIVPTAAAYADDGYESKKYGATIEDSANYAKSIDMAQYAAYPYYVFFRVENMGKIDEYGYTEPVRGAKVTIYPLSDAPAITEITDNAGIVAFNIKDIAENPFNEPTLTSYNLTAEIGITAEGYRTFETGYMNIMGGTANILPLRSVDATEPYPHKITYQKGDVLYTVREVQIFRKGNYEETLHIDFRNVKGESVRMEVYGEGVREPLLSKLVRVKNEQASVDFTGQFQKLEGEEQLPVDTPMYVVIEERDRAYAANINLRSRVADVDEPELLKGPAASAVDLPTTDGMQKEAETSGAKFGLSFTFPEDWWLIGGSTIKPALPAFPINFFVDPSGYFQLTVNIAQKTLSKYDSAKDKRGTVKSAMVEKDGKMVPKKDENGNLIDVDGNIIDDGYAKGDEKSWQFPIKDGWEQSTKQASDAIKNKFKGVSLLYNYERTLFTKDLPHFAKYGLPTGLHNVYQSIKNTPKKIGSFFGKKYPEFPDGTDVITIETKQQEIDWKNEMGEDYEFLDGFVNVYVKEWTDEWDPESSDVGDDTVGTQSIDVGSMPIADKLSLAMLFSQAEAMGITPEDYATIHVDENSTGEEVQRAIVMSQISMLLDIIREEQQYKKELAGTQGVFIAQDSGMSGTEPFAAAAADGFESPWESDGGASEKATVPEDKANEGLKSFQKHSTMHFGISFSIEAIAKWQWPRWNVFSYSWQDGSILIMAKVRFTLSFSFKVSWQLCLFFLPIVVTIGIDITATVDACASLIRTYSAEDLDKNIVGQVDQYKHNEELKNWGALFPLLIELSEYRFDFASSGLVITLSISPWISIGIGCDYFQPVSVKLRLMITLVFSFTMNQLSDGPYKDKSWFRFQLQCNLTVSLTVDFIFFTNTWSKDIFPSKGSSNVLYDTWGVDKDKALEGQADGPVSTYTPNPLTLTNDDLEDMTIVSSAMLSKMSEMDGELLIDEQADEEVFNWEDAREDDYVAPVDNGADITYAVFRMPEYDESEVLEAQAILLGDAETTELGNKDDSEVLLGTQDSGRAKKKTARLRRTSTVVYKSTSTGLLSMADGNEPVAPDIRGVSRNGWLSPTDVLLTPEKPVVGDPHMKVVEYATYIPGEDGNSDMGVTVTAVFRICSVEIDGKPRSRILMSLLDARDMKGNTLEEKYQQYIRNYDKKIIEFDVNDIDGINRSDMYDYDFDVLRKNIVAGDGVNTLGSDMLQIVIVSGVRNNGDETTLIDASTSTVFTYLTIPVENLYHPVLVYSMKISIMGSNLLPSLGTYHMISNLRIQGGETLEDSYAIIAFIDRASNTPEGTLEHTGSKVSVGVGFILVDFNEGCFLIPNFEQVALNLGAGSTDPRIVELKLSPKIGGYYLLALKLRTENNQHRLYNLFLVGVPDDLSVGTQVNESGSKFFTFSTLKFVATSDTELVPCTARDCFFAAFDDVEGNQQLKDFVEYGKSVEGTEEEANYDNGTMYSATSYEEYVKQFDKKRELHKVWFEDVDTDCPVMKDEQFGPKSFNVCDFGINSNGTFIFWPENTQKMPDGEGSPIYDVDRTTCDLKVVERSDDDSKHVIRASRIHQNLAGEITFSKPFILGEVEHELQETVVASARHKYSPLTLLSKDKVPLINDVGDEYINYSGDALYPASNIYFTAIPNVNSVLVDECINASKYVVPGCDTVFDIIVRNVGNTYLSGCSIQLCAHTFNEDGEEEITKVENSVTQLVFDSESIIETEETPINDEGVFTNIEDDWSLAPGQRAAFRIVLPIPADWGGEVTISAIAFDPIMAEHGGVTGLVDEEDIVYMDYSVEPGEYNVYSYIKRVQPNQPARQTYMSTINVGAKAPSYTYRDNPVVEVDPEEIAKNGFGVTDASANGNASGNGNSGVNGANAEAGSGAGAGANASGNGTRMATAHTADITSSVAPALMALTGAALLNYERRRAKNEDKEE